MAMKKLEYQVSFTTPAFLGNAEQQAQWRTPPFKALIRQWWRIATAKRFKYDHVRMREEEGVLFGHAWLKRRVNGREETWASQSQVRLRIDPWDAGTLHDQEWPGGKLDEIVTTRDGRGRVRADLYLGFGPVSLEKRLSHPPAMYANRNTAKLRLSGNINDDIVAAIQLIRWFGAMGGRSRNGWGSVVLSGGDPGGALPDSGQETLKSVLRAWTECLDRDWAHAIGTDGDGYPLVWVTQKKADWRGVMSTLAHLKVGIRGEAKKFRDGSGIGGPHLLGYPAGRDWILASLGTDARLAAQLRAKVINTGDGLIGMLFHLPCRFPDSLRHQLQPAQRDWLVRNERHVWTAIHSHLDANERLARLKVPQ